MAKETGRLVREAKLNDEKLESLDEVYATQLLLAIFYVESRYDGKATGDKGRSYGISQFRLNRDEEFREYWQDLGINIDGSVDDPTTQIAFGIAEFAEAYHLSRKAGVLRYYETTRRYNGSGIMAKRYATKVIRCRLRIFGKA